MERTEILAAMDGLMLYGWPAAYAEIIATAVKRQHEPQRIVGDLLTADLSEKQARAIKHQIAIAKLPLAKKLEDFVLDEMPVDETLVRDLAGGACHRPRTMRTRLALDQQRSVVLIGGAGTGKTHMVVAIVCACIRGSARGRFVNVVDLVNKLEAEAHAGRQGCLAGHLGRLEWPALIGGSDVNVGSVWPWCHGWCGRRSSSGGRGRSGGGRDEDLVRGGLWSGKAWGRTVS